MHEILYQLQPFQPPEPALNNVANVLISSFGGIAAALVTYYLDSQGRTREKRTERYLLHRNTLVQVEHEIIPLRLNIGRDLKTLDETISGCDENTTRVILRTYKLDLSSNLGINMLDINFINKYSELYTLVESINSDLHYLEGITESIKSEAKQGQINFSGISTYLTFLPILRDSCRKADELSLSLLSMIRCVLNDNDAASRKLFELNGVLEKYKFSKKQLIKDQKKIITQENRPFKNGKRPDKFVVFYLDLKKRPVD